jgi:2-polyprenyl-6-methoxyphenol hydroxylase-like FAD-dependent oxidoreductase
MARKQKIAVIGSGIGGLAVAAFLKDQGHGVTIYTEQSSPSAEGGGLIVPPSGQAVLERLGILRKLMSYGVKISRIDGERVRDEKSVVRARYGVGDAARFGLALQRLALIEALHDAAVSRGVEIETDHMVLGIDTPEEPYLIIEGARQAGPFDLVVDASGARSGISSLMSAQFGYGMLSAVADAPKNMADIGGVFLQRYDRAKTMAGLLPIGTTARDATPKVALFWSMKTSAYDTWRERDLNEWKAETYAHWPDFEFFLSRVDRHDDLRFETYNHGSLNRLARGRIAYVGDAAHQSAPQLGHGANHALLDAMTLARALNEGRELEAALKAYSLRRLLHMKLSQAISGVATPMFQSDYRVPALLRDAVIAPISATGWGERLVSRVLSGDVITPHGLRKTAAQRPAVIAPEPGE